MRPSCGSCGHTAADHADGIIGSSLNGTPLCRVNDHSCYDTASVDARDLPRSGDPVVDVLNRIGALLAKMTGHDWTPAQSAR